MCLLLVPPVDTILVPCPIYAPTLPPPSMSMYPPLVDTTHIVPLLTYFSPMSPDGVILHGALYPIPPAMPNQIVHYEGIEY